MKKLLLIPFSISLLTGCETMSVKPSTNSYDEPVGVVSSPNSKVANKSFSATWDELVSNLSSSFFVINNVDKESRLINMSFSTSGDLSRYLDCGVTKRDFSFAGEEKTFKYNVASQSFYKHVGTWGAYNNLAAIYSVTRTPKLDGRMNVYVAPKDSSQTTIKVNVRYILSVDVLADVVQYNGFGQPVSSQRQEKTNSNWMSFNTGQVGTVFESPHTVKCVPSGDLEKEILDLVSN